MTRSTLVPAACAVLAFAGCKGNDLGKPCTVSAGDTLPSQPIGGEQPLVEVVTVERSTACESFQCLQARGYAPYCTRECAYDPGGKIGGACTVSADCARPQHCFAGRCRDDDCPAGFECQSVQDVGPLVGKLFCVYKEHCNGSNRECEDLGTMDCVRMGCFDSTLVTASATAAHTLMCEPREALTCQCADPTTTDCSGTDLTCYGSTGNKWPSGSVEVRDVCMRRGD